MRRPVLLLALVALAAVIGGALWRTRPPAAPAPAATPPNVLLITLDTTRADRLGSYGYAAAATPHLDRLAAAGVRFDQALSPVPLTLPAHASVMTGRQPYAHGVRNNGHFVLPSETPTLATAFAAAGYDTAAFVSAFVLDRQFGLGRGFAVYNDTLDPATGGAASLDLERRGDRTVAAAAAWLSARALSRPYFLWVHLFDPHDPYAAPSPFREQFADRPYDGEVAFTDAVVGRLLERAGGASPSTLVIVAGDHGESLGEHGESTHGLFVYESALRVPLIMAGGGIDRPAVVSEPVRLVDVAATIADLAALPAFDAGDGRSLRPLFGGATDGEAPPPAYAETYFPQFFMGWAPLTAVRVGTWKYIEAPEPELYDLSVDDGERTNLIAAEPARAAALRRVLQSTQRAGASTMSPMTMSDDARQRLAALGYLSAVTPPHAGMATTTGADPKRMVAVFEELLDGNRALAGGRAEEAARIARGVRMRDPGNAFARLLHGRAALALGRHREAMAAFTDYLALVPQSADAHHWLALAALRLGDRARALAEEEAAVALDPAHTNALALRAGLLFSLGRRDEGITSLEQAVARDPDNTTLIVELADLLADAGRTADAEAGYRRVLARDGSHGRALTGLGVLLATTRRLPQALEYLTRAVDIDARDEEARFARAEVLGALGQGEAARAEYAHLARTATRPDLRDVAAARARSQP